MELQKYISQNISSAKLHFDYFTDYTKHFISQLENGFILTNKGVKYSKSSIRQYKAMLDLFQEFEKLIDKKILNNEINYNLSVMFERFLVDNNLSKNSIGQYLSKFKAVLSNGFKEGLFYWNGSGVKIKKELTTKVKLSVNELQSIRNTEMTKHEERCVDIYTILFFTGMRNHVLEKFLANPYAYIKEHDGTSYIEITADKTEETQVIPIGKTVMNILQKHNYKLKPVVRYYLQKKVQEVAKRAGLTQPVAIRKTVGGKTVEYISPKFKEITTHTGKRSFVSHLRLKGVPISKISAMTGNKDEKQLAEYDRSSKLEQVQDLVNNEFFNTEI